MNLQQSNIDELLKAETFVWKHYYSFMNAASLECALQLGIPDVVHKHGNNPMITLSQLTSALPIHPSKSSHVYRLMRILVNAGFFVEKTITNPMGVDEKCFSLTTVGQLLTPDGAQMASKLLLLVHCPPFQKSWTHLSHWYKNDDASTTPFEMAHGKTFWGYIDEDLNLRKIFYEAMEGDSEFTSKLLMEKCSFTFEGLESLVDVGGGTGETARAIVHKFPNIKCSVFDLPNVAANQQGTENLEFVGGSMFDEIPQTNAILLKFILHNWNDEACIKILNKCKEAIYPSKDKGGKVIVVDIVMVEPEAFHDEDVLVAQNCFDMHMFVQYGGKERTEKELAILFQNAGFGSYKVFPLLGYRSLVEVYI